MHFVRSKLDKNKLKMKMSHSSPINHDDFIVQKYAILIEILLKLK